MPLVFLSGTVREDEEDTILRAFGVNDGDGILTIRENNTQRPCLKFGAIMYRDSASGKQEAILDFIVKRLLESEDTRGKVMIFEESEASVNLAQEVLPTLISDRVASGAAGMELIRDCASGVYIHGKMTDDEKRDAFHRMTSDLRVRFCICTTIWSRGVNFSNIIGVMQAYICYDG